MIKFYETFKQNENVSFALTQAQYWLRNLTHQEFEELLERIKPELDQVLAQLRLGQRLMIKELIKQIKQRGEKPFANPYYWAAFGGIGV